MRPLILEYTEKSKNENLDFSKIEYSTKLNLTVDKKTGLPAIKHLNMSTQTHTRTYNETSDSDNDNISLMMGTITKTSYQLEGTDDDVSFSAIKSTMATSTFTFVSSESSDNDR